MDIHEMNICDEKLSNKTNTNQLKNSLKDNTMIISQEEEEIIKTSFKIKE